MKHINSIITLLVLLLCSTITTKAQTWNFSSVSSTDKANLSADKTNWTHESTTSNDRYKSVVSYNAEPLMANGVELDFTKGLLFTTSGDDAIRVDVKGGRMAMNKVSTITIKGLTAGSTIAVNCKTSSSTTARGLNVTNVTPVSGSFNTPTTDEVTNVGTVDADGDVTLTNTGGLYVYSIKVSAAGEEPVVPEATYNSVARNAAKNQMYLSLNNNSVNYYNTDDIFLDIDNATGKLTVKPNQGTWSDIYDRAVTNLGFSKTESHDSGDFDNDDAKVEITKAETWFQSAFIEWSLYNNAASYNVYVKGENYADYTKIDYQLVRNYGTYGRADVLGLKAGTYEIKVVPVDKEKNEIESAANTATNLNVVAHDRSGFAFHDNHVPGAYNADGTLKSNAVVVYITNDNSSSVTQGVYVDKKGTLTTCTGLQEILNGIKKGNESRPFVFRLIGNIDIPSTNDKGDICVDMGDKTTCAGITIEGVGNDAVANGWGIRLKGCSGVEISNIGFFNCSSDEGDNIGLQQSNEYVWVHNCDMFYGHAGSDEDQIKGDGALDCKKSNYVTFSYNHFWDSGKCNLLGLSEGENQDWYITYHHNWYDHSDSRHPRVRYYKAHVYNNYFDGNAKYGVGASEYSNVFVENNYFRNTNKPMLISMQGTDTSNGSKPGDGTFSGENGGMIKAYGNLFAERSNMRYTPYSSENSVHFDAYEVSSRDEKVPSSVKAYQGGYTYSNFDTDASIMYDYTPDAAEDVPTIVAGQYGAGRVEHGDFQWSFNNATDDTSFAVIEELKSAVTSYKTKLKGIFDGENAKSGEQGGGSEGGEEQGGGSDGGDSGNQGGGETGGDQGGTTTPIEGTVLCTFAGRTPSSNVFTIVGSYSNSKGSATIDGTTYTDCLKLESKTQITFTISEAMTLTLYFADGETVSIKINGENITDTTGSTYTTTLAAGTYTLTKADTRNLFGIKLVPVTE